MIEPPAAAPGEPPTVLVTRLPPGAEDIGAPSFWDEGPPRSAAATVGVFDAPAMSMPFAPVAAGDSSSHAQAAPGLRAPSPFAGGTVVAPEGPAMPAGSSELTISQYASLRVELHLLPDRAARVLGRYGIPPTGKRRSSRTGARASRPIRPSACGSRATTPGISPGSASTPRCWRGSREGHRRDPLGPSARPQGRPRPRRAAPGGSHRARQSRDRERPADGRAPLRALLGRRCVLAAEHHPGRAHRARRRARHRRIGVERELDQGRRDRLPRLFRGAHPPSPRRRRRAQPGQGSRPRLARIAPSASLRGARRGPRRPYPRDPPRVGGASPVAVRGYPRRRARRGRASPGLDAARVSPPPAPGGGGLGQAVGDSG